MTSRPVLSAEAEKEIEHALNSGNPADAAHALMTHRNCSLTDARVEVNDRIRARAGKR